MAEIVHLNKGVIEAVYQEIVRRTSGPLGSEIAIDTIPRLVVSFYENSSRRRAGVDRKIADSGVARRKKLEDRGRCRSVPIDDRLHIVAYDLHIALPWDHYCGAH
jgi:hypothetical protein